ncbi:MAG TPA: hypothetical protein VK743_15150 [Steroidobacteraceae bacterium]|jgi:hypothetical protein|nr:hypothetical protein [Steroidobacteraceae bacterium]
MNNGIRTNSARITMIAIVVASTSSFAAQDSYAPQAQTASFGPASFAVPYGWAQISNPSNPAAATYQSPQYNNEVCRLAVFPPMQSSGDIVNDARRIFAGMMGVDPVANSGPPFPYTTLIRGISPEGWPYFVIKHSIGGRYGEYGRLYGTSTLAVQLGNQTVIVVATGKDPLVSQCFGQLSRDAWPAFFASLHFNTSPSAQQDQSFRAGMVGRWMMVTGSRAGGAYTFTAQGRYLSTTAFSASRNGDITSAYFGNGGFRLRGKFLTLTPDQGSPMSAVIKLEQESKDLGARWTDRLCLVQAASEICYNRSP